MGGIITKRGVHIQRVINLNLTYISLGEIKNMVWAFLGELAISAPKSWTYESQESQAAASTAGWVVNFWMSEWMNEWVHLPTAFQKCVAVAHVAPWYPKSCKLFGSPLPQLPKAVNVWTESECIVKKVRSHKAQQLQHKFIYNWSEQRGVSSSHCGLAILH